MVRSPSVFSWKNMFLYICHTRWLKGYKLFILPYLCTQTSFESAFCWTWFKHESLKQSSRVFLSGFLKSISCYGRSLYLYPTSIFFLKNMCHTCLKATLGWNISIKQYTHTSWRLHSFLQTDHWRNIHCCYL